MKKGPFNPLQFSKNQYKRQKCHTLLYDEEICKTPLSSYEDICEDSDEDCENDDRIMPLSDLVDRYTKRPSYFTRVFTKYNRDQKSLYEYFEKKYCTYNYTLEDYRVFSNWLDTVTDLRKIKNIDRAYRSFNNFRKKIYKYISKDRRKRLSSIRAISNDVIFYKLMKERKKL